MATVNNWLAFSLSPQELPPSQTESTLMSAAATDDVSGDMCFNIPQDWSMRGSELSALVAEPKLEDFLGGISFSGQNHKASCNMIPSSSSACYGSSGVISAGYQLYHQPSSALQFADSVMVASAAGVHDGRGMLSVATANCGGAAAASSNNGGSIGLSMIKNWLRSQPAPLQPRVVDAIDGAQATQGRLSLSMNMAGPQGSGMPVAGERGRAPESFSTSVHGGAMVVRKEGSSGGSGGPGALVAVNTPDTGGSGASAETVATKTADTFGQRTSIYRGVTRHRWTGRYEAHLWDNTCRREGKTRKGRQVYLGGYDKEDKAARAYDLAALKYWGPTTTTNFPVSNYEKELEEMKHMTRQEFVASLRRKSSGFSRGASIYRGVTRHHQHGRWQARIGRVAGNKDLYLGTFSTQEEAAEAYDIAAIKFRGLNAVTNFDMSRYDVKSILESSTLPIGGAARRLKDAIDNPEAGETIWRADMDGGVISQLADAGLGGYASYHHHGWPTIAFQQPSPLSVHYPYGQPSRGWCKPEQDTAVAAAAHSLQDLQQLHLGSAAHNFFQASSSSTVYNGGGASGYHGVAGNSFLMPSSTVVAEQGHSSMVNQGSVSSYGDEEGKLIGYDAMVASPAGDPYAAARSAYQFSQGSAASTVSIARANGYSNNWSSPFSGMG